MSEMIPAELLYKRLIEEAGIAEDRAYKGGPMAMKSKYEGKYLAFVRAAAIVKEMMEENQ